MAEYHSISDLVKLSINNKQELWQVVLTGQAHDKLMSERDVFAQMKKMYQAMKSADEQYDQQLRSPSKMAGGDGYKMRIYNESGRNICGDFIGVVMEKALKMGGIECMHEENCSSSYSRFMRCYSSCITVL